MLKTQHTTRRWTVFAVALLAVSLLAPPVGASGHKTFEARVTPSAVAAGAQLEFTVTLTNTSPQHQLGSVDVAAPAGFTDIHDVRIDGAGTSAVAGNTIELRNLGIAPWQAIDVTFEATSPCVAGTYAFEFAGKQANNFRGPPGNDFTLAGDPADRQIDVSGACGALAFITQPAHAERNVVITGTVGDPSATGVQVAVVDEDGAVVPVDVEIAIDLGADPSDGVAELVGTRSRRTGADGVATFDDLRIDTLGVGYTLAAASPGFANVESAPFGIWEDIGVCTAAGTCVASVSRHRQLDVQVSGTGGLGSAMLLSVLGDEIDCAADWQGPGDYPYNHAPATSLYEPFGTFTGEKIVRLRIDKAVVRVTPNNGAAFYQVCFLGEKPFPDRDGNQAPPSAEFPGMFGPALLPDCGSAGPAAAPCVLSRTKTQGGDMVLTFAIPPADPAFR